MRPAGRGGSEGEMYVGMKQEIMFKNSLHSTMSLELMRKKGRGFNRYKSITNKNFSVTVSSTLHVFHGFTMMPHEEEREKLAEVIRQWNNNRLDLFEISRPDEVSWSELAA